MPASNMFTLNDRVQAYYFAAARVNVGLVAGMFLPALLASHVKAALAVILTTIKMHTLRRLFLILVDTPKTADETTTTS